MCDKDIARMIESCAKRAGRRRRVGLRIWKTGNRAESKVRVEECRSCWDGVVVGHRAGRGEWSGYWCVLGRCVLAREFGLEDWEGVVSGREDQAVLIEISDGLALELGRHRWGYTNVLDGSTRQLLFDHNIQGAHVVPTTSTVKVGVEIHVKLVLQFGLEVYFIVISPRMWWLCSSATWIDYWAVSDQARFHSGSAAARTMSIVS